MICCPFKLNEFTVCHIANEIVLGVSHNIPWNTAWIIKQIRNSTLRDAIQIRDAKTGNKCMNSEKDAQSPNRKRLHNILKKGTVLRSKKTPTKYSKHTRHNPRYKYQNIFSDWTQMAQTTSQHEPEWAHDTRHGHKCMNQNGHTPPTHTLTTTVTNY